MGLTRDEWYAKLCKWLPSWWFEEVNHQRAVLTAIAAIFESIQQDVDDQVAQTFISESVAPILDLHGDERSLLREVGETDGLFSIRIRNIVNNSNKIDIKRIVDRLLITGECTIIEHATDLPFLNRNAFCNRRDILNDHRYNEYFTIVIPRQIPVSNSFANRLSFCNRGNYAGTVGVLPLDVLLNIIVTTVNNAKAGGVLYRLVELTA